MVIAGVTCYAARWPKPDTIPALEWRSLESGRYRATDRGSAADQYMAKIVIYNKQPDITALWVALKTLANRGTITVALGSDDEGMIFGAEVTATSATVVKYGVPIQSSFATGDNKAMYSLALTLRALSPSFSLGGLDNTWPTLRVQNGWKTGSDFPINAFRSYTSAMTYNDRLSDSGYFEGEFLQTSDEMKQLRWQLLHTYRGVAFSLPDIGVLYPFGNSDGFPASFDAFTKVRCIMWEDGGKHDFIFWKFKMGLSFESYTPG